MLSFFCKAWESFFHDKTGIQGCRTAGYMRMGFALLFLIDRFIMLYHLDYFFSPSSGLLPFRVSGRNYQIVDWHQWSIFRYAPESNALIWMVAALGIIQGIFLLLGTSKYPRVHLFGLYLNILSFQNHNTMLWDGEDDMFRIWCFLFLFFPLDCCTVYDRFGFGSCSLSTSWPMWPFRIFQIEIMLIYMGASLGKLSQPYWQDGSSIYRLTYGLDDYPGVFNPDIIFARYGPLKLLCWSALFLEAICWITVWVPALRKLSVVLMILLHIGIDLSMQMHMFELLCCVGWCVFLIQPVRITTTATEDDGDAAVGADCGGIRSAELDRTNDSSAEQNSNTRTAFRESLLKKTMTNIFVVSFVFAISVDITPVKYFKPFVPESFHPSLGRLEKNRQHLSEKYLDPISTPLGLSQSGEWSMYTNAHATITTFRIDVLPKNNQTLVTGAWRWRDVGHTMPNWKRKFYTRHSNYYGQFTDGRNELLHFIQLMSKPILEEYDVNALYFVAEEWNHEDHEMESTGGFWDPVVKHPMDVFSEKHKMVVRIVDGDFKVIHFEENDDDDDDDDDDGYDEEVFKYGDDENDEDESDESDDDEDEDDGDGDDVTPDEL